MLDAIRFRVRNEREKQDLTQQQLADRAGVSRWRLVSFENGDSKISLDFVLKICRELKLTDIVIDDLRLRAAAPGLDLPALVAAKDAVAAAQAAVLRAAAELDVLVNRALKPAGSTAAVVRAAERLAATRPEQREQTGHALRDLVHESEPRGRLPQGKPQSQVPRKKARRTS